MENKNRQRGEKHHFSQIKLQQLEQKYFSLVEEFKYIATHDVSENFDRTVTALQIEKLRKEISLLKQKITAANQSPFPIKIVTYQLLETKQIKTVQLTNFLLEEGEVNPSLPQKTSFRQVSFTSPLGLVLTQKKIGQIGQVETKQKSYWVKIINIKEK